MNIDIFDINLNEGQNADLINKKDENGIKEYTFKLTWTEENAKKGDEFVFEWNLPLTGIMYGWQPKCRTAHYIDPDWCGPVSHMISNGSPVHSYYDGQGVNKCTMALSEAKMLTRIRNGIVEENGNLQFKVSMGTQQFTNKYETEITIRLDMREIPTYEALKAVSQWWVSLGITPTYVPAAAKEPCYSFWYSFHQGVNEKNVEEECRRAKDLGFDVEIFEQPVSGNVVCITMNSDINQKPVALSGHLHLSGSNPCPRPLLLCHFERSGFRSYYGSFYGLPWRPVLCW